MANRGHRHKIGRRFISHQGRFWGYRGEAVGLTVGSPIQNSAVGLVDVGVVFTEPRETEMG